MKYKIGARAHDIGTMGAEKLARLMKEMGFSTVQLVPYKAIEGFPENLRELSSVYAGRISDAFNKEDINIGLLGSYFNLLEKDSVQLREYIDRFKMFLRYSGDFRCPLVGTETGSYNSDCSYNRKNHGTEAFEKVIFILRELTDYAEKIGGFVGIEPVYNHSVYSPGIMKKVIDLIDSDNLKVIFDPVNLFHFCNYESRKEIIDESFELFGEKIALVHLKDFIVSDGWILKVPLGQGIMDFGHLFSLLDEYQPGVDIIIEELEGQELLESLNYLKKYL